jgi:hypothetical protein
MRVGCVHGTPLGHRRNRQQLDVGSSFLCELVPSDVPFIWCVCDPKKIAAIPPPPPPPNGLFCFPPGRETKFVTSTTDIAAQSI